jgi:electron transfer flavoprotein alpha/beta subunit
MKILVPVKRVIDYNVKPRVKADGTALIFRQREDEHEPV